MRGLGAASLANGRQALGASDPWPGYVRLWPEKTVRKLGPNDSLSLDGVYGITKTYKISTQIYYPYTRDKTPLASSYATNEMISIPFNAPTKKEDTYFPFYIYSNKSSGEAIYQTRLKFVLGSERSFSDPAFSNEMIETEEVIMNSPIYYESNTCDVCVIRRTETKFTGYFSISSTQRWEGKYGFTKDIDIPNNISLPLYFGIKLPGFTDGVNTINLYSCGFYGSSEISETFFSYYNQWIKRSNLLKK